MIEHPGVEDIDTLKNILKRKSIRISKSSIREYLDKLKQSQDVFPIPNQQAFLLQLILQYERSKKKEIILLEELDNKNIPVTVILGALAEDWPGMSNSILGIVHQRERNVLFVKGFTVEYDEKTVGIVILAFNLNSPEEYRLFLQEKRQLVRKIKDASRGSRSKYVLLEDETVKFEIYNEVVKRISRVYHGPDITKLIGEDGEAIKFVSSRSREYLEERSTADLVDLILDNFRFQELVRNGNRDEVIKIKNFETNKERLTGITLVCRQEVISIDDFLKTLNFIVPGQILKHHKSYVTRDGILVYRIEIVDRYGKPLKSDVIKSIEKSLDKILVSSFRKNFSQIKTIGGYEHYARAIIPFLKLELKRTQINQVFLKVNEKTDFFIDIKVLLVCHDPDPGRLRQLITRLERCPGIEINSSIPPKNYGGNIQIDILNLIVDLAEFTSIKDIFNRLRDILKQVYGEIRDFDQGFREIDMKVLSDLLEKLRTINAALIRDIFFNFDELFRIEIPFTVLYEVIRLCSQTIEFSNQHPDRKVVIEVKNLDKPSRTLCVASIPQQKQILANVINRDRDLNIYFTRIEWNQRTYFIFILDRDGRALQRETIRALEREIKRSVKR